LDTFGEGEFPKALRGVTPDQATTSSIEFIPPRHARPEPVKAPFPASQSAQTVVQTGKADQQTAEGQQTKPDPRRINEPDRPQNVPAEGEPPALPVQLQQENGLTASRDLPVNEQIPQPEMVQTEIGPLPADLWQLLGESLPGQPLLEKQDLPVKHQNAASPPGRPDPERQAVTAAEATNLPEIPAGQAQKMTPNQPQQKNGGAATVIQRVLDDNEVVMEPVDIAEPAQVETTTQAEPGQADALDLDELARQVFTEIKRRLSVEWERYRWRE
jgi:hypothetical protein